VTVPELALFVSDQPESKVKTGAVALPLPIVVVFVALKLFEKVILKAPMLALIVIEVGIDTLELSIVIVSPLAGTPFGFQLIPWVHEVPPPPIPPSHVLAVA
jgi:hypothetical protein